MSALALESIPAPTTVAREPYLARGALFALTLAPPLVMLLTAEIGNLTPTVANVMGCLIATWICTVVVGCMVHLAVNWSAPKLFASLKPRALAYPAIAAVTAGTVILGLVVLLPHLSVLINEGMTPLIYRGIGIAGAYVVAARAVAVFATRATQQKDLATASEARALRARLAALQAQMNPHFLFNTLNTVASLIHKQPELAETTIERLGGVLQYSIVSGKRGAVPLGDELAAVKDYLGIEEARFGKRLRSTVDVSPELYGQSIPPMLLQPLVENAVLHGLASRESGGEIHITGREVSGALVLIVSDDGVGPGNSVRSGTRVGLSSIRERLELTYGSAAAFVVRERVGGGFECELRIPRA